MLFCNAPLPEVTTYWRVVCSNCYNTCMDNNTGTYIYDKKLGKVVKVSDRVPSKAKSAGHVCDGCCGHCACHDD